MTITPTYPGVYITEVPGGGRTVSGVATSITAFVGSAARGPVDTPLALSSVGDFERHFGGLWRQSGLGYAVRDFFLGGGGQAVVVRIAHPDADTARLAVGGITLEATGPGAWGNDLAVAVEHPTTADADDIAAGQGGGVTGGDLFTLSVTDGGATETYRSVTVVDGPRRLDRVLESSLLVSVVGALPAARPGPGTTTVALADEGSDGGALDADDYIGAGFADAKRGLFALDHTDLVNLIVIPPPTPTGDLPASVWPEAMAYAVRRRAFLVVDPPGTLTTGAAPGWASSVGLTGLAARNAGVYFPRVRRPDPLRGGSIDTFAPSGGVAGLMARTDASRGVWKAPAGLEAGLTGVVDLAADLTDHENGPLNQAGVNALRTFRGVGPVAWGARTLRGADVLSDEYKYVPVRRLALYLEESLFRGTQWVVFEPNDEPLWAQIRLSLGAFMQDLFRQGAFQGSSPAEAYSVRCDSETTTQYDIDRGVVNIEVGFAPLKPAEFVVISIQQQTASAAS
ncbi:phage tail sheath subtilisin-like domain-containing protein [uncultured Serinicoccus sp.]|uniref:phage tail sheath family protein n=1 Tax=uncultured Serinicoccus sp. TaxID=735514 RepID=UPI00260EC682|nr:phage tail sheath subtilisin-like domain-containing protein [uncultured Serinicoccus sp.]